MPQSWPSGRVGKVKRYRRIHLRALALRIAKRQRRQQRQRRRQQRYPERVAA